jgi:type IX secretion system PorP/SprF family membrane protein
MHCKIYTLLLLPFILFFNTIMLRAQDARYSQFYAAPHHLSPAMIGVYQGKIRLATNYREQYASVLESQAFRTFAASFDMRFRVVQKDYIGLGLSASHDQTGLSRFNRTQGNVGLSFMKQLGGSRYANADQYLVAGGQIGIEQRGFDWERLWFSSQFDTDNARINFDAANGENFEADIQTLYLNFNAGLLWYALFDDNQSIYAGGAIYHINTPNASFFEGEEDRLYRRWVAHAGGELPVYNGLSLLPAAIFMTQGPSMSTTFGGNFRYTNRDWKEVALRAGAWVHLSNFLDQGFGMDAIAVTAVLELERWNLGISYDITTSSLTLANDARGGLEISLIYSHPEKSRYKVNCPKY